MRLNPDYKIHRLGKHYMIVDNCADNANMANVYTLNETAGQLWLAVEGREFSIESLAEIICGIYDVDRSIAEADARRLVGKWSEFGFLLS